MRVKRVPLPRATGGDEGEEPQRKRHCGAQSPATESSSSPKLLSALTTGADAPSEIVEQCRDFLLSKLQSLRNEEPPSDSSGGGDGWLDDDDTQDLLRLRAIRGKLSSAIDTIEEFSRRAKTAKLLQQFLQQYIDHEGSQARRALSNFHKFAAEAAPTAAESNNRGRTTMTTEETTRVLDDLFAQRDGRCQCQRVWWSDYTHAYYFPGCGHVLCSRCIERTNQATHTVCLECNVTSATVHLIGKRRNGEYTRLRYPPRASNVSAEK